MEQKPFAAFLDLVKFDRAIHFLQVAITNLSQELDSLNGRRAMVVFAIDEATTHVVELLKQVKEKESEMALVDEQEKEKRTKLGFLSEYRDIKAMQSEIDALKHAQMSNEQQLMQIWNKLDQSQKDLIRIKKQQEQELVLLDVQIHDHATLIAQKQEELAVVMASRAGIEAPVPREWLECYSTMSSRVSDPVVIVEYDACSACFTAIAKQDLLRLERRAVIPCRLCFRLLYLPRVMNLGQSSSGESIEVR
jgi:predicted  nucleic acid-binding Zn-ribbon protein